MFCEEISNVKEVPDEVIEVWIILFNSLTPTEKMKKLASYLEDPPSVDLLKAANEISTENREKLASILAKKFFFTVSATMED
jgi:hypothetical protein